MAIVTSGITIFVLVLGPGMLSSSTLFARVSAMVNDHGLPCWLLNFANSILVILLRLLISLDSVLIKSKTHLILDHSYFWKLSALIVQSSSFILEFSCVL